MPFVFNDPLHWIIKASEAREIAAQMTDLGARTDMLTIAHEYEKIAQRAAERLGAIQVAKPCEQTGATIKLSTTRPSHDHTATMPTRYTVWVKTNSWAKSS